MKLFSWFAAWALFANAQTCFGGMIFTLTPTDRVDATSTVRITYTVTGAADVGTQDIGSYFVRAIFNNIAPPGSFNNITNVQRAADLTPFGNDPNGPYNDVSVTPSLTQIRWLAPVNGQSNGKNVTITTAGATVGSFDLIWNRPATGQYDVAIPLANFSGAYKVAPFDSFTAFTTATAVVAPGVSTIITEIPEPSTLTVIGLAAWCGTRQAVRRRR